MKKYICECGGIEAICIATFGTLRFKSFEEGVIMSELVGMPKGKGGSNPRGPVSPTRMF